MPVAASTAGGSSLSPGQPGSPRAAFSLCDAGSLKCLHRRSFLPMTAPIHPATNTGRARVKPDRGCSWRRCILSVARGDTCEIARALHDDGNIVCYQPYAQDSACEMARPCAVMVTTLLRTKGRRRPHTWRHVKALALAARPI